MRAIRNARTCIRVLVLSFPSCVAAEVGAGFFFYSRQIFTVKKKRCAQKHQPRKICGKDRCALSKNLLHRYAGEDGEPGLLEEMHDQLRLTIQKTFGVSTELAGRLLLELLQCVKRKNLVRQAGRGGDICSCYST